MKASTTRYKKVYKKNTRKKRKRKNYFQTTHYRYFYSLKNQPEIRRIRIISSSPENS